MQQAVRIETVVNEEMVRDMPDLRPLLGHRVQMIALDLESTKISQDEKKISFDEFLKHRLKRPEGIKPVTLEDMEAAIIKGAIDGNI